MTEKIYNDIILKIRREKNLNVLMEYNKYCEYIQIIKDKVKYNNSIYNSNKELFELSEIAILIWGLYALSTVDFLKNDDKEHIGMIFHSLTTQISNNMLSILILCNNSLDHQAGVIMRSTCELCFSLIVLMINKDKRKKYFDTARFNNEIEVWNKEFKLKDLNNELIKFENIIFNNNSYLSKRLSKFRNDIYKKYSEYTHNSFFNCCANSYTYNKNYKEPMYYNLWGENSSRVERFLTSLCQLNLFTCLELIQYISKNIEIKRIVGTRKASQDFWDDAGFLFLIFEEYCIDKIAEN